MSNPTQQTPTTAAGAGDKPGSVHPLVRALDQLIDQVKLSYAAETDLEWKRNTGFELQGIRRARTVVAAALGPNRH